MSSSQARKLSAVSKHPRKPQYVDATQLIDSLMDLLEAASNDYKRNNIALAELTAKYSEAIEEFEDMTDKLREDLGIERNDASLIFAKFTARLLPAQTIANSTHTASKIARIIKLWRDGKIVPVMHPERPQPSPLEPASAQPAQLAPAPEDTSSGEPEPRQIGELAAAAEEVVSLSEEARRRNIPAQALGQAILEDRLPVVAAVKDIDKAFTTLYLGSTRPEPNRETSQPAEASADQRPEPVVTPQGHGYRSPEGWIGLGLPLVSDLTGIPYHWLHTLVTDGKHSIRSLRVGRNLYANLEDAQAYATAPRNKGGRPRKHSPTPSPSIE